MAFNSIEIQPILTELPIPKSQITSWDDSRLTPTVHTYRINASVGAIFHIRRSSALFHRDYALCISQGSCHFRPFTAIYGIIRLCNSFLHYCLHNLQKKGLKIEVSKHRILPKTCSYTGCNWTHACKFNDFFDKSSHLFADMALDKAYSFPNGFF